MRRISENDEENCLRSRYSRRTRLYKNRVLLITRFPINRVQLHMRTTDVKWHQNSTKTRLHQNRVNLITRLSVIRVFYTRFLSSQVTNSITGIFYCRKARLAQQGGRNLPTTRFLHSRVI